MTTSNLPIAEFFNDIVQAVNSNPVVIIEAETGAGKSTQVPQYLLMEGYEIIITQPRRLAARTVAERVAEELDDKLGNVIGFKTAYEEAVSTNTECLFCTDGLALVRELLGEGEKKTNKRVLVIDEVHEWNLNIEVLVAWCKKQISLGLANFKLVLMSATIKTVELSKYFDNAPVISVPGRLFDIKNIQPQSYLEDDIKSLIEKNRNILVFLPGKQEIQNTIEAVEAMQLDCVVLPLHGELSSEEQAKCFATYDKPKVVCSTNVAQTSITINDIDAVIDLGVERRIEIVNNVEGLYLRSISLADSKQRKGRAGRCKEGIYIDRCKQRLEERLHFPIPEINRVRLDQCVLKLLIAGFDMEELEFFHQPNQEAIHKAKESLIALNCINSEGKATDIGKRVNQIPLSCKNARMLVEGIDLGVGHQIAAIAAISEVNSITNHKHNGWYNFTNDEKDSDLIAQLNLFENVKHLTKSQDLKNCGINVRSFYRMKELHQKLLEFVPYTFTQLESEIEKELISKAIFVGFIESIWQNKGGFEVCNGKEWRQMNDKSVVSRADWVVGVPFDLEIQTYKGHKRTLNLIGLMTKINPEWIQKEQLVLESV